MTDDFNVIDALYSLATSEEVNLPTGGVATIKEMTGNEQRNFMNRAKLMSGVAIQELLNACTETIDEKPISGTPEERQKFFLDMLAGDRQALIFHIRRYSLGDNFMFSAKCPNAECAKTSDWEVELGNKGDFQTKVYKYGKDTSVEYMSSVKPGLKIKFKHLNGHAEMTVLRKRNSLTLLTDLELREPQAWDPTGEGRWVGVMLNKLPDRLITEMRREIKSTEGGVDTTVTLVCENCQSSVMFDLILQQDFMTPSATS